MKFSSLLIMGILHFLLMFFLMYAMVDIPGNIYLNLNQVYMAGIMTTSMMILEVLLMKSMYEKKVTYTTMFISSILFLLFSYFLRRQTFVDDREFLKSMIPHHGGAILMCGKAQIKDQEIKDLCEQIIISQQSEIDQMKVILERF